MISVTAGAAAAAPPAALLVMMSSMFLLVSALPGVGPVYSAQLPAASSLYTRFHVFMKQPELVLHGMNTRF